MMTQGGEFDQISGLEEVGVEFLAAAGIEDLKSLAHSHASSLHEEMLAANAILKIDDNVPSESSIEGWIAGARDLLEDLQQDAVVKLAVADEPVVEEQKAQLRVLDAIPVAPAILVEQKVAVGDVPVMEEFVEVDAPVQIEDDATKGHVEIREVAPKDLTSRFSGANDDDERAEVEPLQKNPFHDIRKAPSPALNEGKKPHSRSYIRGVLHPQPFRVRMGALITLFLLLLIPSTFVAGGLILAKVENWVWYSIIPGLTVVFGLLYLMCARGMRCRICGQPLFASKRCHRHAKAHHLPLIGYIFPTCIRILIFSWFRCTYCGTSVRIKE